jgi:hypothetical protein
MPKLTERPLAPMQARFVDEYLVDLNASAAAALAGRASPLPEEPPTGNLLNKRLRDAIARVDDECRIRPLGMSRWTGPLASIYDILAETRENGTDIPEALGAAMQSFVILSHQRRLLAITLARALPEIERLCAERSRLAGENARLKADAERLDWLEASRQPIVTDGGDGPFHTCNAWGIYGQCEKIREAIDAARSFSGATGDRE